MTVDEIKSRNTMADILSTYGIRTNRAGMCCCPFHKEKTPSCKIYKDGFKCFACGATGDIFKFVQLYEGCSFKDAFLKLGGEYEKKTNEQKALDKMRFSGSRKKRDQEDNDMKEVESRLDFARKLVEVGEQVYEPFSDGWTFCQRHKEILDYMYEELLIKREEVPLKDVIDECNIVRRRFYS